MTMKQVRYFLLSMTVVLFTACGVSTGADEPTVQALAFEKIEAYATHGEVAPTVQDYIDAGAIGITEENLNEINEVVENLVAQDVDTKEEIQALADELGIVILTPPTPTPTPPTPTTPTDTTAPIFTSSTTASVSENQTSAITLVATDISTLTYSISGTDAASFLVNTTTGVVTFNSAPDFEIKNSYTFTAKATDTSSNETTQIVSITIEDVVCENPVTHNWTNYCTVISPFTEKVWLDRNLGAERVCEQFDDSACYGDYYQWGRSSDGHEDSMSTVASIQAMDVDSAGIAFITSSSIYDYDWAKTADRNGSLRSANWSKTDGTSVCPVGFRVPSLTELRAETLDEGVSNRDTAFNNFLKLPSAGYRDYSVGSVLGVGSWGGVWASSVVGSVSQFVYFGSDGVYWSNTNRADALSVRCLRD